MHSSPVTRRNPRRTLRTSHNPSRLSQPCRTFAEPPKPIWAEPLEPFTWPAPHHPKTSSTLLEPYTPQNLQNLRTFFLVEKWQTTTQKTGPNKDGRKPLRWLMARCAAQGPVSSCQTRRGLNLGNFTRTHTLRQPRHVAASVPVVPADDSHYPNICLHYCECLKVTNTSQGTNVVFGCFFFVTLFPGQKRKPKQKPPILGLTLGELECAKRL